MLRSLLLATLFTTQINLLQASAGPSLVFDLSTHQIIDQRDAGQPWYPASLTKMMTAYLTFSALRAGKIQLDQEVVVSSAAASEPASKIGLNPGDKITIDKALQATLVYSANDMAVVLAEAVGGTGRQFVDLMNKAAAQLGLSATHFATANGLHAPSQVTTARDMALLTAALLQTFPEYRYYFSQANVIVGEKPLRNRNALLRQMPEADGIKTGYTCNSGFNLAASATIDGRTIIAIVFGAPDWQTRANWTQARLMEAFHSPKQPMKIEDVANTKRPAPDLSADVCLGKAKGQIKPISKLMGWGVSRGVFVSYNDAEEVIRSTSFVVPGLDSGVVKLPAKQGYIAGVWSLGANDAKTLCTHFSPADLKCDLITPEAIEKMKVAAAAEEEAARKSAQKTNRKKAKIKK